MVYLQCGYEDECETKDCLNCPRKQKITIEITHAEATCVEDFAVVDIEHWIKEQPDDLDLSQKIMFDLMKKVFGELIEDD